MTRPAISIVMATYNGARYLREAIDSLREQTLPPSEIVVVDDGSVDETPDILRSYGDAIVVVSQQNQGHSAARNAGLSKATGDYVALMDHDDVSRPERLEQQWNALRATERGVACFTGYWLFDSNGPISDHPAHVDLGGLTPLDYLSGVVVHYPTAFFDRRKAADVRFPLGIKAGEDVIFCAILATRGAFALVPASLYGYRMHGAQLSRKSHADRTSNRYFEDRHDWVKAHWQEYWPDLTWPEIEASLWRGLVQQTEDAYWARNREYFLNDRDYIKARWPSRLPRPAVASWRWSPGWLWSLKNRIDALRR